jgi:hypothetical protein
MELKTTLAELRRVPWLAGKWSETIELVRDSNLPDHMVIELHQDGTCTLRSGRLSADGLLIQPGEEKAKNSWP